MLLAQAAHLPQQDYPPEQRPWLLERQEGQQVHALIFSLRQQDVSPSACRVSVDKVLRACQL